MGTKMLTHLETGKQMDKWQLTWLDLRKLEIKCMWGWKWGENHASSPCHSIAVKLRNLEVSENSEAGSTGQWYQVKVQTGLLEGFLDNLSSTTGRGLEDFSLENNRSTNPNFWDPLLNGWTFLTSLEQNPSVQSHLPHPFNQIRSDSSLCEKD